MGPLIGIYPFFLYSDLRFVQCDLGFFQFSLVVVSSVVPLVRDQQVLKLVILLQINVTMLGKQ